MHAILASTGTDGDILPYMAIGSQLAARGHRVTLVTNEDYEHRAAQAGFSFQTLITNRELAALLSQPDFWHPIKTAKVAADWGAGKIRQQYELLASLAGPQDTVLISNPAVLGARLVHELTGRPLVSVVLQPWFVKSLRAPPIMPGGLPTWTPRFAYRLVYSLLNLVGGKLIVPEINALRSGLRLPPLAQKLFEWWWSNDLILGLFPAWYAPPQADWLPQIKLTGFPMPAVLREDPLPEDLLAFCRGGQPPIAFSFGSGMMHAGDLFRAAVAACELLDRRGVLLTRYTEQIPKSLPDYVRHWPYAPFEKLFPRCAAVVHHGGVGTTAQALAAGVPQLIIPFAFDQPDNANRVRKLGAGARLLRRQASGPRMARALQKLITDRFSTRCRELAGQTRATCGSIIAADLVEGLVRKEHKAT